MSFFGNILKDRHSTHFKEGDMIPEFSAKDQDGNIISSESMKGKKTILYFYPQDDTSGCTAQSCNLRDNYPAILKQGYDVIGVSADDEKSHKKFISKYHLPFPLIADVDKQLIKAFDVWGTKTIFGKTYDGIIRTTFVIGENGVIEKIINEVNTKGHTEQIIGSQQQTIDNQK